MNIGIIGCENLGGVLGELWHRAGHRIFLASREPDRLQGVIDRLGQGALAGDIRQAANFGEVIVICVTWSELGPLGEELYNELLGKTVIATAAPDPEYDSPVADKNQIVGHALLPGSNLVRAFTTVPHDVILREAHRDGERVGIPMAGETKEAVAIVASLIRDAGFEPVVVGGLKDARLFNVGTSVHNRILTAAELRAALGKPEPGAANFLTTERQV
jgi:predicted dinucleotide-binding enzyme